MITVMARVKKEVKKDDVAKQAVLESWGERVAGCTEQTYGRHHPIHIRGAPKLGNTREPCS
jgi:hypothetical protein